MILRENFFAFDLGWFQTGTKCLADLCGALHCDFVLSSKKGKSKCNPAAAAKNRHLCEVLLFFILF